MDTVEKEDFEPCHEYLQANSLAMFLNVCTFGFGVTNDSYKTCKIRSGAIFAAHRSMTKL
jgi:hypothetical protein